MGETGSGLWPMTGFIITATDSSGSANKLLRRKLQMQCL